MRKKRKKDGYLHLAGCLADGEEESGVDAMVHFGTHGTEFMLVRTENKTIKRHKKRNTYKSKTEKYTKSYFVVYIL